jgi:adenosylcobinamide kinase/adenosylcobinamide-phosphate guanylyltransferase
MKELILGGVRSGKSRLAEQRARSSGLDVVYIVTATAGDEEMRARIAQHRARRPANWSVVEEPLDLARALDGNARATRCVVVDCLTLWLTNWLCREAADGYSAQRAALLEMLPALPGHVIFVANETGLGIMPLGELTRRYCDEAGSLHQAVAARCERVTLAVAGLPLYLKGHSA